MNQNRDKIRELTTLNVIMMVGIIVGALIGLAIDNILGGLIFGVLVGFIGRSVYLRKKYRELIKETDKKSKGDVRKMTFSEAVASLTTITIATITETINTKGNMVAFMGFSGCPFCQKFAPKFKEAVEGQKAYFVPSREASDLENIQAFRKAHNIPTVPALIVVKNGQVKVICDSSLSVEDIKEFIE
ncbi:bacteriocin transport accessory protein, putative [Granulicatella balaenopterae]|uniref:Bacteriocin transport accessory protein, putative n=1 Tax=Granulicatella balaenopterae TaxID=137733 RepID=A0A1H9IEL3_9LACT|nr:thioredoxin domain-containing protein [Granulicatella balaenopterae]SEQ72987.1 bacteriocin transport accessory protein, putative [Granulicatella balaenopterae]